jgi:hypothetical protein
MVRFTVPEMELREASLPKVGKERALTEVEAANKAKTFDRCMIH